MHDCLRPCAAILLLAIAATGIAAEDDAILTIDRLYDAPDLDGPSPRNIRIAPDSSRVTFLRAKADDPQQMDLWEYNVRDGEVRLLVDSKALVGGEETLSEEEKARRERLRIVGQRGIVGYEFSPDGDSLLFPLSGDLYLYDLASGDVRRLTATDAGETDARFSATGRFVSFVRNRNLVVIDVETGAERPISSDGGGTISYGMAEFIAQEEMDRYTGYWWSPDDRRIAFTRVDESPIAVVERFEVDADEIRVYEQRYPWTGTPNAVIEVGVFDLDDGDVRWLDLGENVDIYVPRVAWFPDGETLAVQRQSRDQQSLQLVAFDAATGTGRVLLEETSDTWLNLHNDLVFLDSADRFIWLSEQSGHAHLYLYDNDGTLVRPLTAGDWDVVSDGARGTSAVLHVDEDEERVYFSGTLDTPTERHVYVSPLDGSAPPERLSARDGMHSVTFAPDGSFYVDRFSNVRTPPRVSLHEPDGSLVAFIEENRLDTTHPYFPYLDDHPDVEFGTLLAEDGQVLHYRIKKPADLDADRRYPAVVSVYGGPMGQQVRNAWSAGFEEVLVANGYVVFEIDNRGTGYRGVDFDAPLYRRLGDVEVCDQATGVEFLAGLEYVDGERIGIYGHSYGGYMALMALMKAPELFAAGVSGAPVTDWTLYDTHYTERYMGTPADNAGGYAGSAVMPYVDGLEDPLLIIHGMADDNVLFTNSTKVFKALQDAGKPFDVMTYPGSKHSIAREPSPGRHMYAHVLRFFDQHLQ